MVSTPPFVVTPSFSPEKWHDYGTTNWDDQLKVSDDQDTYLTYLQIDVPQLEMLGLGSVGKKQLLDVDHERMPKRKSWEAWWAPSIPFWLFCWCAGSDTERTACP